MRGLVFALALLGTGGGFGLRFTTANSKTRGHAPLPSEAARRNPFLKRALYYCGDAAAAWSLLSSASRASAFSSSSDEA